jgi:hypothetical protein
MERGTGLVSRGLSYQTHAKVRLPSLVFLRHLSSRLTCTQFYHRVSSTIYSADARFVMTGSDDGNVRIWKARAAEKMGVITARERAAIEYRDSLRERWKHDSEVGKIMR